MNMDIFTSSTTHSLRQDFYASDISGPLKDAPIVSLRSLEDGGDVFEDVQLDADLSLWRRLLAAIARPKSETDTLPFHDSVRLEDPEKPPAKRWRRRKYGALACTAISVLMLCFFGVVHLVNVLSSFVPLLRDDVDLSFLPSWNFDEASAPVPPLDLTRDVTPVHCHSHNDYWRRIPLYEALAFGCTGVEADVWLFDDELFVGHNTNALTKNRTFRTMYVDPLVAMLDHQNAVTEYSMTAATPLKNGVFTKEPSQTLVLLVDFKNNGTEIFPYVNAQLSALRERNYLSYFDGQEMVTGPITVVATGNAPFDLITANATFRDIFFDAPLERLYEDPVSPSVYHATLPKLTGQHPGTEKRTSGQGAVGTDEDSVFDATNSFYASVDFKKVVGWIWWGRLSEQQMRLIRGQIQGAKSRGLKARYWGTPNWPIALRNHVWDVLVREGVDYLNGDDLKGMTKGDWQVRQHHGWLG